MNLIYRNFFLFLISVNILLETLLPLTPCYGQEKISNPVFNVNFPDPTIIRVGDTYYAYATNGAINGKSYNIPVAVSKNLQVWEIAGDALPQKPTWATKDFWAPHVLFDPHINKYILFYSGEKGENTGKCLGVAFSDTPIGPFTDKGSPLICGTGFVNIDPFAFIDPKSGKKLLYWGSGHEPIRVQELADDWKSFAQGSEPVFLIHPYQENTYDRLIEGAWIDYHKGSYYLYYSGDNCCGPQANYAVLVAKSESALGPFVSMAKSKGVTSSVILEKDERWLAPGHNSIFRDQKGKAYIAYHAIPVHRNPAEQDYNTRVFLVKGITYKKGWPFVK
ncbi:glycoside hydrolase family 43 protein [Desertivirga xinjiangensis]|uniref:glycoside hydrolase family 43 protein n=1 Tax=Desertivirga xinjiangensis TaxID=539206 RepID=UPI00210BE820|nr:glycoside hydrolase family 43 protein [Pedobacter xinjiangensis]